MTAGRTEHVPPARHAGAAGRRRRRPGLRRRGGGGPTPGGGARPARTPRPRQHAAADSLPEGGRAPVHRRRARPRHDPDRRPDGPPRAADQGDPRGVRPPLRAAPAAGPRRLPDRASSTATTACATPPTSPSARWSSTSSRSKPPGCRARTSSTATSSSRRAGAGPAASACTRASYRLALRNAGFEGFRILTFQQGDGVKANTGEAGLKLTMLLGLGALNAFQAADVLNDVSYAIRPFEVVPGLDQPAAGRGDGASWPRTSGRAGAWSPARACRRGCGSRCRPAACPGSPPRC